MNFLNRKHSLFAAALAVSVGLVSMGCESTCERTGAAIRDINTARIHLSAGLANPTSWAQMCGTLSKSESRFRGDADYLRSVSDDYRRSYDHSRCAAWDYVQVCRGGWVRRPYLKSEFQSAAGLEEYLAQASAEEEEKFETFNARPRRIDHRRPPRPRPVPIRPRPRPHHPSWRWVYVPRLCETVRTCIAWRPGYGNSPTADQALALAYEFDQAAAGIETTCDRVYSGASEAEVALLAQDSLNRLNQRLYPDANRLYNTLGCAR